MFKKWKVAGGGKSKQSSPPAPEQTEKRLSNPNMKKFIETSRKYLMPKQSGQYTRKLSCLLDQNLQFQPVILSVDQIKEYELAFSRFDRNNDGTISLQELNQVLRSIGLKPSDAELLSMITAVDKDKDGVLSKAEFIKLMSRQHNPVVTPLDQVEAVFRSFDTDGNGFISEKELSSVLCRFEDISEEQVKDITREITGNQEATSSSIDRGQFMRAFAKDNNNDSY
eukprot:sb/3469659/